jgi:small subunit ribosomal protein S20
VANNASAKKRIRQSENNRIRNVAMRSRVRTFIKKALKAISSGDKAAATVAFQEARPIIDSMVNKGILHRNTAARAKSRLNSNIKAMA